MTARQETLILQERISRVAQNVVVSFDDANTLRRAQITLHRWHEMECGDGNEYSSWSIERDEQTGIPYRCVYPHKGEMRRYRIADKEAGAIRRIKEVCARLNLNYFIQTDPRGCSLYVSRDDLTDSNYSRGLACVVEG